MMNRLWTWFAAWLVAHPKWVAAIITHCKKHPYFHIYNDGDLYMARYWLVKERKWLPFAIRLHEWHRPDGTRDMHDHPYDYRTILLSGWYLEQDIFGKCHPLYPGETKAHRREFFHNIIALGRVDPTYSLFIYWGKSQMWGFLVDGKKMPWKKYVEPADYPAAYHEKRGP